MDQAANLRQICGATPKTRGMEPQAPAPGAMQAPHPAPGATVAGAQTASGRGSAPADTFSAAQAVRDRRDGAVPAHGEPPQGAAAADSGGARVIAVVSGKGGVGKSTIAAALGVVLTRAGHRVLCLDGDVGMANLDIVLCVQPPVTLADVLEGRVPLHRAVTPTPFGPDLLAGITGLSQWSREPAVDRLWQQIRSLADLYDVVIVDTGAGCARHVLDFARAADEVLLVTTPDRAAVSDAGVLLKTLAGDGCPPVKAVVNEVERDEEYRRVQASLSAAGHLFGVPVSVLGAVRRDPAVAQAARDRQPVWQDRHGTPALRDVERIAAALLGDQPRTRGSFWSRLRKIWAAALPSR